jgi:hypothetical protein
MFFQLPIKAAVQVAAVAHLPERSLAPAPVPAVAPLAGKAGRVDSAGMVARVDQVGTVGPTDTAGKAGPSGTADMAGTVAGIADLRAEKPCYACHS